jgi:hypothetical protein
MLNVGFGVTALCKGLKHGTLDGIGTYTKALMLQWSANGAQVSAQESPRLIPFSFSACAELDMAPAPLKLASYPLNTAWSVVTQGRFWGLGRLATQVARCAGCSNADGCLATLQPRVVSKGI